MKINLENIETKPVLEAGDFILENNNLYRIAKNVYGKFMLYNISKNVVYSETYDTIEELVKENFYSDTLIKIIRNSEFEMNYIGGIKCI